MKRTELSALLKRQHKYRAKPVEIDGVKFPSKAEANRWFALATLEKNGAISGLQRQVPFDLAITTEHGAFKRKYVADYVYQENGQRIVEDCKGFITDVYRVKRDLMFVLHGIKIRETGRRRSR